MISVEQYSSKEIDSVRDLYLRRGTELADLGKVFLAACMVLRLHTMAGHERAALLGDIDKILNMLHSEYSL